MRVPAREATPPHASAAACFLAGPGAGPVQQNRRRIAYGARRLSPVTQ
ncbi:hypothetical protein OH687_35270 [Burkholderia anthina]|nr:hypothetical protein OH687_35270 [Burkholderia anthina]